MKFARDRIQMEKQVTDQQREIETVTEEKNILDKEFSAYKTRVHSVLKQQKEQHTDPAQLDQVIISCYINTNIFTIFGIFRQSML